ncbi:AraC family transcriptional regulator [Paenibacillus taihuensis]|uniref:AraC family transcriptional regulator n=1 Tax=Paenibacillus taihuensis TaxID=1156355 RepID=A0A3D9RRV0_9BACL|nr:helix-turn-helix domain-containing protein [Paenibacillus taihuensis]REE78694.1 AraC family transcriptional regulator [Paenibacillus taihuensis]
MITWRPERLAPYVEKLVWLGSGSTAPFTVYPDIYPVMGFQNIGQVALVNGDETQPLEPAGLTGIHGQPKVFQATAAYSSILVYFRPEALFKWRLCSPKELSDTSVALADLGLNRAHWDRLLDPEAADDPWKLLRVIEELLWKLFNGNEVDLWAAWAVDRICAEHGSIRVGQLAEESTLSRRQFERRFVERVGVTPKSLAQIVKFQRVLQSLQTADRLTQLAHDADYYDQSHLIREFRKKTGATPGQMSHLYN